VSRARRAACETGDLAGRRGDDDDVECVVEHPGNPEGPADPVAEYVADWANEPAVSDRSSHTWRRPTRLAPLIAALALLLVVAIVVSRRGDDTANTSDADSIRTAGTVAGSTSSTTPLTIVATTPGTEVVDAAPPGSAIDATPPSVAVPTTIANVAPAVVVATTTTTPPCQPDLAITAASAVTDNGIAVVVTVENRSDCTATNVAAIIEYSLNQPRPATATKGTWHQTEQGRLAGTWVVGSMDGHVTETVSIPESPLDATTATTAQLRVDPLGQTDPDPTNNAVSAACASTITVDIAPHDPLFVGGNVSSDVTVRNDGPCDQHLQLRVAVVRFGGSESWNEVAEVDVPADGQDHTYTIAVAVPVTTGAVVDLWLSVTNQGNDAPMEMIEMLQARDTSTNLQL